MLGLLESCCIFPRSWRKPARNLANRLTASFGRFVVFAPSDVKQKGSMTSQEAWQEHAETVAEGWFCLLYSWVALSSFAQSNLRPNFWEECQSSLISYPSTAVPWKRNLIIKGHWSFSYSRKTRGELRAHLQTSSNLWHHLDELSFTTSLVKIQLTVSSSLTGHSLTEN